MNEIASVAPMVAATGGTGWIGYLLLRQGPAELADGLAELFRTLLAVPIALFTRNDLRRAAAMTMLGHGDPKQGQMPQPGDANETRADDPAPSMTSSIPKEPALNSTATRQ